MSSSCCSSGWWRRSARCAPRGTGPAHAPLPHPGETPQEAEAPGSARHHAKQQAAEVGTSVGAVRREAPDSRTLLPAMLPLMPPKMMLGPRPLAPLVMPITPLQPARPSFSFASLLTPPWVFVLLATILAWNQTPLFSGF